MKPRIDRRTAHQLKMMQKAFKRKFGRDPGPNDPVFFDPDADTPERFPKDKMQAGVLAAMKGAGLAPELIYAYRKTGELVSETNMHLLPRDVVERWQAAIDEYFALEAKQKPDK